MQLHAIGGDITQVHADAIVNAANSTLLGGGGVDGAIHRAAGSRLLAACRQLRATKFPEGLPVGQSVATPGFDLPARWVIHTVGSNRHAGQSDPALLRAAFVNSLAEAVRVGARTVAFPAISGGVYGWDMAEVARVGVAAVHEWPSRWRASFENQNRSENSGGKAATGQAPHENLNPTGDPGEKSATGEASHESDANEPPRPATKNPIESVTFVLFSPEALRIFQAEIERVTAGDQLPGSADDPDTPLADTQHRDGMTLVDAYWIPDEELAQYCADREAVAAAYTEAFRTEGYRVFREWAGSEDGEAVTASDDSGRLLAAIHLDPMAVEEWREYQRKYGERAHAELVKTVRAEHSYLRRNAES